MPGGDAKRFYDPAMQATLDVRLSLARDLHCALAEKQLSLYYPGQVDQTGHVLGAESDDGGGAVRLLRQFTYC